MERICIPFFKYMQDDHKKREMVAQTWMQKTRHNTTDKDKNGNPKGV